MREDLTLGGSYLYRSVLIFTKPNRKYASNHIHQIQLNLLWFRVFIRETANDTMAIKLEAEGTMLDKKKVKYNSKRQLIILL